MAVRPTIVKPRDIQRLIEMLRTGNNSGGHMGDGCTSRLEPGSRKKEWSNLAKRYLAMIAEKMGLSRVDSTYKRGQIPPNRFEVYFNAGGPAVAGDVYLNTDKLHVCIAGESSLGPRMAIMYRRETKEPKYMGHNQWMPVDMLAEPDTVANKFEREQKG